jgi:hypothetical protein
MLRRLASKNIRVALVVSGVCLVMFGFTFFVAAVYVS